MPRFSLILLIVFLFSAVSCELENEKKIVFSGNVVDNITLQPIPGASVSLFGQIYNSSDGTDFTADHHTIVADSKGAFIFNLDYRPDTRVYKWLLIAEAYNYWSRIYPEVETLAFNDSRDEITLYLTSSKPFRYLKMIVDFSPDNQNCNISAGVLIPGINWLPCIEPIFSDTIVKGPWLLKDRTNIFWTRGFRYDTGSATTYMTEISEYNIICCTPGSDTVSVGLMFDTVNDTIIISER